MDNKHHIMNPSPSHNTGNQTVSPQQIVEQYGPLVSSIAYRMTADPDKARDAAQEAWLEILKSLPTFEGCSSLSTWIYTVASRVILKTIKKDRVYTQQEMAAGFDKRQHEFQAPTDIEKEFRVKESCDKCLTAFLYCLDAESKLAFLLKELGDLSYREIASILEKSETAVRQTVSRSKKKLTAFMDDRCFLFNSGGTCSCRIKPHAIEVNLDRTVNNMLQCLGKIRFFKAMDLVLPSKNYWEKFI